MKTITIISFLSAIAASAVLFSCSESVEGPPIPETDSEISPKIQRIIDLANSGAERFYPSSSRADARIAKASGIKTVCESTSRGANDTLIYVVNYENNKGFALISGVNTEEPLLAVVPNGSYDPAVGTDNPGFNMYMEAAKLDAFGGQVDSTVTKRPVDEYPMRYDGKYVKEEKRRDVHFGPAQRIKGHHGWGQTGIYGQYCPTGRTGSAPITIASIITFLRYYSKLDNRIYYTFPGADVPYEDIEWIEIFRHHNSLAYFHDGSHVDHICWAADKEAVHKTIGRLCRQIGYDAFATYEYGKDVAVDKSVITRVLRKYIPEYNVSEFTDFGTFKTMDFINIGLIYLRAHRKSDSNKIHDWYTDGYEYCHYEHTFYVSDPPDSNGLYNWKYWQTTYSQTLYNSMKWNWDGEYDGWYSVTPLYADSSDAFVDIEYVAITEK